MSLVSLVDCLSPLYRNPPVWSPWACETRTRAFLGILLVVDGSMASVRSSALMCRPSCQSILSSRIGFSFGYCLESLDCVEMEEGFSFGFSIYDLWDWADYC